MSKIELSTNQKAVLELAVSTGGRLERYPGNLQGGARTSVVRGLLRNGLVEPHVDGMHLTPAGYEQVGATPPAAAEKGDEHDGKAPSKRGGSENDAADGAAPMREGGSAEQAGAGADAEQEDTEPATPAAPQKPARAKRAESKQSLVVGLLTRPEGATIAQIMAATAWQQHSVRGFIAGTVKKKGYQVISTKEGKEERVYRIKTEEEAEAAPATVGGDEEE